MSLVRSGVMRAGRSLYFRSCFSSSGSTFLNPAGTSIFEGSADDENDVISVVISIITVT